MSSTRAFKAVIKGLVIEARTDDFLDHIRELTDPFQRVAKGFIIDLPIVRFELIRENLIVKDLRLEEFGRLHGEKHLSEH